MSIHAQISKEAEEKLAAQKRTSSISSIVIALLSCVLVALILLVIALNPITKETVEIISFNPGVSTEDTPEKPETQTQVERKPAAPASSMAKVIAAATASTTAVPVPDISVEEPSLDFGNGDDFGDGWGSGDGDGAGSSGFANIPSSMQKRCSKADRLQRLTKEGGTPECEEAVVRSLNYLQKTQNADGSWESKHRAAMTGLALLSYLGHCETPQSAEYGETVEKAIIYLVGLGVKNKGRLAEDMEDKHWPYEHGIATYALAEAFTFCGTMNIEIPNLKQVVQQAGSHIVAHQHSSGGWVYHYEKSGGAGDTSIACWQLQALKACKHTGLSFKRLKETIRAGAHYIERSQNSDGTIGYRGKNHSGLGPTLTGAGLLCLQQAGMGAKPRARKAAKWINENAIFDYAKEADLYSHYYNGQAMINVGGSEWRNYNNKFMSQILSGQNSDGSWKSPGTTKSGRRFQGGSSLAVHYRTCLGTLMLEVYYRFLPGSSS